MREDVWFNPGVDISICLGVTLWDSICGKELDLRDGARTESVLRFPLPWTSQRRAASPRHRSRCRVAGRDPWLVSGLLTACLRACSGSLPTGSLLIISQVKPALRKSRSTVSKPSGGFYPLNLFFFTLNEPHKAVLITSRSCSEFRIMRLFKITFCFFFLKRCVGTEVSIFQSVSAPSGWMDIMWLLKKNVGVKVVLIYDVIRNLTFLPQHYCQGAMVIRQPIHFSRSRLATLLRICLLSNYVKQTTPSVVFYVPRKFQLCRVCRWLKTSCIGANECDLGAKLCKSERSSRLFLFTRPWLRSGW